MLEAACEQQASETQEQHILVIDDHDCGVFALDAATYSIGRDSSNAIVLKDESVSRQHALLLRMPVPGENRYQYRLIDGNAQGNPSRNGTVVNGEPCKMLDLVKGDSIQFGRDSFCTYLTISGAESELSQYIESAEFQSIKAGLTDSKETAQGLLVLEEPMDSEDEDSTTIFAKHSIVKTHTSDSSPQAPEQSFTRYHLKMALGGIIIMMIVFGGLLHTLQSREDGATFPTEKGLTSPEH